MLELSAVDFISSLPIADPQRMMSEGPAMRRGFFTLLCLSEKLESIVSGRFQGLASALVQTSLKLYQLVDESVSGRNGDTIVNPSELRRAFKRFENVLLCINELYNDLAYEDIRAQPLWVDMQEYYRIARYVFVKNPNLIVD